MRAMCVPLEMGGFQGIQGEFHNNESILIKCSLTTHIDAVA